MNHTFVAEVFCVSVGCEDERNDEIASTLLVPNTDSTPTTHHQYVFHHEVLLLLYLPISFSKRPIISQSYLPNPLLHPVKQPVGFCQSSKPQHIFQHRTTQQASTNRQKFFFAPCCLALTSLVLSMLNPKINATSQCYKLPKGPKQAPVGYTARPVT